MCVCVCAHVMGDGVLREIRECFQMIWEKSVCERDCVSERVRTCVRVSHPFKRPRETPEGVKGTWLHLEQNKTTQTLTQHGAHRFEMVSNMGISTHKPGRINLPTARQKKASNYEFQGAQWRKMQLE